MAMAILGAQAGRAQAVDPDAALRAVEIPGKTVEVPGNSFREAPIVEKLCQQNSQRALVRDRSGRVYVNEADLRQVMLQGRQIAEASDRWARLVIMQTQVQKAMPSRAETEFNVVADPNYFANRNKPRAAPAASTQQANLDYNFAVLDAKGAQLDGWALNYAANLWTVELNTLRGVAQSGGGPLEKLEMLKQFDWFSEENAACLNERALGQKASTRYAEMGWPSLAREEPPPSADSQAQRERGNAAFAAVQAELNTLSAPSIAAARPLVAAELAKASASSDVARAVFTVFGTGRLSKLAMQDPEIRRNFDSRATALRLEEQRQVQAQLQRLAAEEEKRAQAKRTRIAASVKGNSVPTLADLQEIVLRQSMLSSVAEGRGMKGQVTSASSYQLTADFLGQTFKTATASIDVSGLACRPVNGMQQCTYTETFGWTRYAMFESVELPHGSKSQQRSIMLKWTSAGLKVDGEFEVNSLGWITGSSGGAGSGRKEKVCVTVSLNGFQDCRYY